MTFIDNRIVAVEDYQLLKGDSSYSLSQKVNEYIKKGYVQHGSPYAVQYAGVSHFQAVVKLKLVPIGGSVL